MSKECRGRSNFTKPGYARDIYPTECCLHCNSIPLRSFARSSRILAVNKQRNWKGRKVAAKIREGKSTSVPILPSLPFI
jgi:hypothetical protein